MPAEEELASAGTCHELAVAALAVEMIAAIANIRVVSDWDAKWQRLFRRYIPRSTSPARASVVETRV